MDSTRKSTQIPQISHESSISINSFDFLFIGNNNDIVTANVFKTSPVIEPEKLLVHGSLVKPIVKPRSNR